VTSPESEQKYRQEYEYQVFSAQKNALDAETACKRWGGNLASIQSTNEANRLNELMQYGGEYWIGLNSYQEEGKWKWTDNSPVQWINWKRDHPQVGRNV